MALSEEVWAESDLSESDLSESDLSESDLSESDLSESDLSESDLSESDLSESELSELASFSRSSSKSISACIIRSNISGSENLYFGANLSKSFFEINSSPRWLKKVWRFHILLNCG